MRRIVQIFQHVVAGSGGFPVTFALADDGTIWLHTFETGPSSARKWVLATPEFPPLPYRDVPTPGGES